MKRGVPKKRPPAPGQCGPRKWARVRRRMGESGIDVPKEPLRGNNGIFEARQVGVVLQTHPLPFSCNVQTGDIGNTCSETWYTLTLGMIINDQEMSHALESRFCDVLAVRFYTPCDERYSEHPILVPTL